MARTVDREKLAAWQRRFARHHASGLTVAEFCRREGVESGRWKYWHRQVERLTTSEPSRAASRAVFQAVEIIPRRAVVVRVHGGATLEIPDDRIDLVRLAIDRMAALPEADACWCAHTTTALACLASLDRLDFANGEGDRTWPAQWTGRSWRSGSGSSRGTARAA